MDGVEKLDDHGDRITKLMDLKVPEGFLGKLQLLPGQRTDTFVNGGDKSLYLLSGCLNVLAPENEGQKWFEVHPRDGFYVPKGMPHEFHNMSAEPLELVFGVAPAYHAQG